jgi:hypothetical protein
LVLVILSVLRHVSGGDGGGYVCRAIEFIVFVLKGPKTGPMATHY